MAFPLSSILNEGDQSPRRKRKHIGSDDEDDDEFSPFSNNFDSPSTSFTAHESSSTAHRSDPNKGRTTEHILQPPMHFSPQRGSLYNRRAGRSPTRVPNLLTPPLSQSRSPDTRLPSPVPPSPETHIRRFSIFQALLDHPGLMLEMSKHLDVEDLISLYAISKDFHLLADARFTTMILGQSVLKAPESSRTFTFKCYANLCMADPAARPNESVETHPLETPFENPASKTGVTDIHIDSIRCVPSFRWLRMILYRESVIDDILACLTRESHRLPKRASLVLKKLWFVIDISDNGRRIGMIHNKEFFSSKDLFVATMFFFKLDMRLTDPMTGNGETGLRSLLLAQRSLTTLLHVLQRRELTSQLDLLRLIVQHHYRPPRPLQGQSVLGVPWYEVGQLQYEGWGKGRPHRFIPIEDLVMRETVKRGLGMEKHYLDMMLHGYVNKKTWENMWTGEQVRAKKKKEREEAREAAREEGEEDEGDEEDPDRGSLDPEPEEKDGWESDSIGESEWETDGEVGKVDWDKVEEWSTYEMDEAQGIVAALSGVASQ